MLKPSVHLLSKTNRPPRKVIQLLTMHLPSFDLQRVHLRPTNGATESVSSPPSPEPLRFQSPQNTGYKTEGPNLPHLYSICLARMSEKAQAGRGTVCLYIYIYINSVAFCSPAKSLPFSGLMGNPLVSKKLKVPTSKQNATKYIFMCFEGTRVTLLLEGSQHDIQDI